MGGTVKNIYNSITVSINVVAFEKKKKLKMLKKI